MSKNENKNIWKAINISIDSKGLDDKTIDKLLKLQVLNEYLESQN